MLVIAFHLGNANFEVAEARLTSLASDTAAASVLPSPPSYGWCFLNVPPLFRNLVD